MESDNRADMGFANLDLDRMRRSGFAEVVFCQGKDDRFLQDIFKSSTRQMAR